MSVRYLLGAIYETAKISLPTLAEATFGSGSSEERAEERLQSWSDNLLSRAGIRLTVTGLDNAPRDEAFVVMSNHQSHYDIPVIFASLRRPIRMVTKKELFKIPIWGRAMRQAGFVEIDRQDHERAIESMHRATGLLARGMSVWVSPEGTRSRDGNLGAFRKGGFHLALDASVRILPVAISGTREVLAAKSWTVHPGAEVSVVVCPAIDASRFGVERLDELVRTVRDAITSARATFLTR